MDLELDLHTDTADADADADAETETLPQQREPQCTGDESDANALSFERPLSQHSPVSDADAQLLAGNDNDPAVLNATCEPTASGSGRLHGAVDDVQREQLGRNLARLRLQVFRACRSRTQFS